MPGPLFPVQNFVAKPYSGALQGINVALLSRGGVLTNDGQTISPAKTSKIVNATIDFLSTPYLGQAVSINLQSSANTTPLQKILMIYVDNELNSQNVTVAFPDTQQYIGIPAFTTGYYPVLTGQFNCVVYNGTTGKVPVTANSKVSVIFCDFAIPGFLSQETLNITVNSSTGPVVPVIGDQTAVAVMYGGNLQVNPITILPTVVAPVQYVLTGIEINSQNLFTDGVTNYFVSGVTTPPQYTLGIGLAAPVPGNPIPFTRLCNINMRAEFGDSRFFNILDETGLNIPVQGLILEALNIIPPFPTGFVDANLPPWAIISVTITYALVTL